MINEQSYYVHSIVVIGMNNEQLGMRLRMHIEPRFGHNLLVTQPLVPKYLVMLNHMNGDRRREISKF